MGDNNYPTDEQRTYGPLEAERRFLERQVEAGKITQSEMDSQYEEAKKRWRDEIAWGGRWANCKGE